MRTEYLGPILAAVADRLKEPGTVERLLPSSPPLLIQMAKKYDPEKEDPAILRRHSAAR